MIYLRYDELIYIAERAIGPDVVVRDHGLLESALARPQASVFGRDAYPTLMLKAAALTHSLVRNHGLVDGNKRLGLSGLIAFLGLNGMSLTWTNDEAYEFIVEIASGALDEVSEIAERIERGSTRR
ncbi:type II toxin-antitoxin system death-on-curing family toxin [Agreia sp. Leaf283]|uniref:type II toxin-antitoxin system death-on-curing family toxin n=1 Tax=Agreia sp. Leaf283 TaxID=1736321 RepID=UPI000701C226|nr:type II toxin-antitoxin system death-on-curing family toxin [Agreia sp. Leaf283]KQP57052.1 death-on-curing protein [Agreia sp. Leaf283]